jgi:DNA-binding beta-propeller fold protein YncE
MICKDCEMDKKAAVSIWSFSTVTNTFALIPKKIDVAPIAKTLGVNKVRFKPSASAVNPLNGDIYMVSAVNKVLVVADSAGTVQDVYQLNPSLYRQPEGIAFTPTGDLLISNEVNLGEFGNILILKRKTSKK